MLQLENIRLAYGPQLIFSDVNLQVAAGEICCINTGVLDGATTLLKCMGGIVQPVSGSCRIDGTLLPDHPDGRLVQLVSFCYESGGLVSLFSVYENIVLPLVYHRNVKPEALEERVTEIASALFIQDCLHHRVHELNDVQMRLVNLARALVVGAKLLLLDETQEGMSPQMRDAVLDYLLSHRRDRNLTLIMTTTAGDSTDFADRFFSIADKQLREH